MSNKNLPVKKGDDFLGEFETMDLSDLKDKQFLVAINTGDPNGPKFVCSSIRGPFSFTEMCQAVGLMWREHQHHAKVVICEKDMSKYPKYLDSNTVDYIEAKFEDIITDALLEGLLDADKQYTCRAGINEIFDEDNPLLKKRDDTLEADSSKVEDTVEESK